MWGPHIGRDSAQIDAGFAILWGRCHRLSTYLYYDGNIGRDSYASHAVSGGLRVGF